MKALNLASSPSWWVRGRRKVNASPVLQSLLLLFMLLAMFGPLLNLLIWTVAESWYFPHSLPSQWGLKYWYQVFNPYSDVSSSLLTSVLIALLSVGVCLLISVPPAMRFPGGKCRCGCCLCCYFSSRRPFPT